MLERETSNAGVDVPVGTCGRCRRPIMRWRDAGRLRGKTLHKGCWVDLYREASQRGEDVPVLKPPYQPHAHSELPVLGFLLLFHIGIGVAVGGWVLVTQTGPWPGIAILLPGLLMPLAGVGGLVREVMDRRRDELIRDELERTGGWKALP